MAGIRRWSVAGFSLFLLGGLVARAAVAQQAALTVHVDQPGVKVSPMLYGIFFEEINHAGDGGLYAELVRNRSFEDADTPEGWSLATAGAAKGDMALDTEKPLNAANRKCLRLKVEKADGGRIGVANNGNWGMAARKGAAYHLSLYARAADGFKDPLVATLENADGSKTYAQATIDGLGADWKRFTATLTAAETDPAARLVIAVRSPGTVWLDMVSLFPADTFKGRPNGLRADLAQMLADLKPAFVRFPGGCWVEGDTLRFAMRWKQTIGDLAERRTQFNLWKYFSTNGLGYHEYLQMCEDLGAEPLFVINCGMSHKENVPMEQMGPWVQDALDAIEYANGTADSKWGALRAKNGHPAPFNLKTMEIGNENHGLAYEERYALFHDAIKAKYPQMRLVADTRLKVRPMDIVDEHYYNSPEFFIGQAARYDAYDRGGPKIYVGEYAVTRGAGKGNLHAALGEAAFMTGMERNADVVILTSYAPLFVNVNDRRWNPDLIQFDSARSCGTPSYFVQKMFSANRPDVALPVEVKADAPAAPKAHGAVGVGTWATQAEFKDVKVTQDDKILFASDFSKDSAGWKTSGGQWKVQDGALRQTGRETDCRAVAGDPSWTDYTVSLKARKTGGAEGFLIPFHVRDQDNYAWWNIGGWGNTKHGVEVAINGHKRVASSEVRGKVETGRWYDIRIEVRGPQVRCYLDGKKVHEFTDSATLSTLYACAGRDEAAGEVVLKVVNVSNAGQDTQIDLAGAKRVDPKGTAIVLTSAGLEDENSLDEPTKVAPVVRPIDRAAAGFRHIFPPHSVTVLRLKAQ